MKVTATWTLDRIRRKLRREDRLNRNALQKVKDSDPFYRGYFVGRAHACSELLVWLDQKPKRKK